MGRLILGNYVELPPDTPVRLVLTRPRIVEIAIRDPKTGLVKTVRALEFDVLEENGKPVHKVFRTLSEKLAQTLMAIWEKRKGDTICVIITRHPMDFATEYEVELC